MTYYNYENAQGREKSWRVTVMRLYIVHSYQYFTSAPPPTWNLMKKDFKKILIYEEKHSTKSLLMKTVTTGRV